MQNTPGQQQPPALDKGALITMGVLFALMFGYYAFYYAPAMQDWQEKDLRYREWLRAQETAQVDTSDAAEVDTATRADAKDGEQRPKTAKKPPKAAPPAVKDERIPFETPEHAAVLSTAGASVHSLTFKNILGSTYAPVQSREADRRKPEPFQVLHLYDARVRSFALRPLDDAHADVATRDWSHRPLEDGGHEFTTELDNGLVLRKQFLPPEAPAGEEAPRLYHMRLRVIVENPTDDAQQFGYMLYGPAGMVEQELGRASYGHEYVLAARDEAGRVEATIDVTTDLEKVGSPDVTVGGRVSYWGLATKYFTALAVPTQGTRVTQAEAMGLLQSAGVRVTDEERTDGDDAPGRQGLARGIVPELTVAPGAREAQEFLLYVGPRQEPDIFEQEVYAPYELDEVVYYGWFGSMGRLLVWILSGLHSVFGNWGVAILLLTFVVRGLLMPLSMWSQRNMFRMQKLGPEINKLKEKFSSKDGAMSREQQQAFQAAQMELWRKHGVNPVGCIGPIFLQMPIFIGLYNALNYSSALRHSHFALWITDLSQPDVLFRMPFTLPLLGTNAFSVLPLLMVATYVVQQQLQPTPTDERMAEQQKMMKYIMPLIGFLFYTMPSGLMLYFLTSSVWGICEQKVIKKKIESEEGQGPASKPRAKSKQK